MHRHICLPAALAAALLAAASAPAQAATVTETYAFSFSNFIDVGGAVPSPISAISGSVTLTFDPTVDADNVTSGVVVNYLNGAVVDSPIGYTYFAPTSPGGLAYLSIGGIAFDADFISFGTNDLAVTYKFTNPASPQLALCSDGYACGTAPPSTVASGYTLAGYPNDGWLVGTGSIPEPGVWALMLLGFGVAGGALRSQRRLTA
jgi:hypothetical protein